MIKNCLPILLMFSLFPTFSFAEIYSTQTPVAEKVSNIAQQKLFEAIDIGNYNHVIYYLKNGASINELNYKSETPLMRAIINRNFQITKLLLDEGADPNYSRGSSNRDCLSMAIFNEDYRLVKLLLEHGSDPNRTHKIDANTALFDVTSTGNVKIAKLLVQYNVDIQKLNSVSKLNVLSEAVFFNKVDLIKYYLSIGINPNVKDSKGYSIVYDSVMYDHKDITKLLLDSGADFYQGEGKNKISLIDTAIYFQNIKALEGIVTSNQGQKLVDKKNLQVKLRYMLNNYVASDTKTMEINNLIKKLDQMLKL